MALLSPTDAAQAIADLQESLPMFNEQGLNVVRDPINNDGDLTGEGTEFALSLKGKDASV